MKLNIKLLVIISLIFVAIISSKCTNNKDKKHIANTSQVEVQTTHYDTIFLSSGHNKDHMILSTLFHKTSGEFIALCYQAFNIAKMKLIDDLKDTTIINHRVIILDVDETVLDNTPYQETQIIENTNFPSKWDKWCKREVAKAVPGALDFLKFANDCGVSIYYLTNRSENLKEATINNLKKVGFPQVDDNHVIMKTAEDSKMLRRKYIANNYHISLLIGDNLKDFSEDFEIKDWVKRNEVVNKNKNLFGSKFIIIPNAMYGDWEIALYENIDKTDSLKYLRRLRLLDKFENIL